MKQLHKQSSYRRGEEMPISQTPPYSPKSLKHSRSIQRSISYLLREQRLLFILVGILIASTFFIIHPSLSWLSSDSSSSLDPRHRIPAESRDSIVSYESDGDAGRRYGDLVGRSPYFNGVGRVLVGIGRKRKRVVVTGGAGFVGSHLVDKLIARGDDVIVIDNFFYGEKGECGAFAWESEV